MAKIPDFSDLLKAGAITAAEVDTAVDVFMRDATVSLFRFASGHTLNPAAAVKAYQPARASVVDPDRPEKFRRRMVRAAILLARPAAWWATSSGRARGLTATTTSSLTTPTDFSWVGFGARKGI